MNQLSASVSTAAAYTGSAGNREYEDYRKNTGSASAKSKVSGATIGNPQLSEKASQYYEELKKKYSGMNFILVSRDQKQQAQANAANYASADKMVVLIDEDKVERMAVDEAYRSQYEGLIANAASGLSQLQSQLTASNVIVKGYGMQIDDKGMASYFAVLEKSNEAQRERIEKKAEEKREAKKEAARKAEQTEQKERMEKSRQKATETITIKADSIEELIRKIQDASGVSAEDAIQTEEEKKVGQNFDFSV